MSLDVFGKGASYGGLGRIWRMRVSSGGADWGLGNSGERFGP